MNVKNVQHHSCQVVSIQCYCCSSITRAGGRGSPSQVLLHSSIEESSRDTAVTPSHHCRNRLY